MPLYGERLVNENIIRDCTVSAISCIFIHDVGAVGCKGFLFFFFFFFKFRTLQDHFYLMGYIRFHVKKSIPTSEIKIHIRFIIVSQLSFWLRRVCITFFFLFNGVITSTFMNLVQNQNLKFSSSRKSPTIAACESLYRCLPVLKWYSKPWNGKKWPHHFSVNFSSVYFVSYNCFVLDLYWSALKCTEFHPGPGPWQR